MRKTEWLMLGFVGMILLLSTAQGCSQTTTVTVVIYHTQKWEDGTLLNPLVDIHHYALYWKKEEEGWLGTANATVHPPFANADSVEFPVIISGSGKFRIKATAFGNLYDPQNPVESIPTPSVGFEITPTFPLVIPKSPVIRVRF
jgi:hypothetical protein